MTKEKLLSAVDIARELNIGKTTAKFLLKRFKQFIPSTMTDGQLLYSNSVIPTLFSIQSQLEMGVLPGRIEEELMDSDRNNSEQVDPSPPPPTIDTLSNGEDLRLSKDGLQVLQSVFNEIGEQQKRIAKAHEKRAEAEERKAVAIEKRAEAEEKKADAMNNIAAALQEMNKLRSIDSQTQQIVHQAASAISADEETILDESEDVGIDSDLAAEDILEDIDTDLEDLLSDTDLDFEGDDSQLIDGSPELDDLSTLVDQCSSEAFDSEQELDDLSLLLDDIETGTEQLDDLSALIDESLMSEAGGISEPEKDQETDIIELDDLSLLIDTVGTDQTSISEPESDSQVDMDDLYALIDDSPDKSKQQVSHSETDGSQPAELDDLYKLIDNSLLADQNGSVSQDAGELDDLSALIKDKPSTDSDLPVASASDEPMDDLSLLIDSPQTSEQQSEDSSKTDEIVIDITPEDDIQKYKAAVMQVILGLKNDGLTVEETTEKLNASKVKTLSGKPEWGQKAILQIYKFIDAAK